MAQTVGRNVAAPLLFLNFVMYATLLGFSSWCLNRYINGQTYDPSFGGNGVTGFYHPSFRGNGVTGIFLTFAILAGVVGVASKFAGGSHIRAWRYDSLAAAGSASIIAWAITALAFGLACKEISVGGHRGWSLRVVEAFTIILTFTQLLFLLSIHAGMFSSKYGPGYDYGVGARGDHMHTGTGTGAGPAAVSGTRVV